MLATLAGAASVGSDREVAAERFGGDSRRAPSDLEGKALGRCRTDSVFTRPERDGELTVHAAVPGGYRELRGCVSLDVQSHVARMRHELIATCRIDEAIERDVAARRLTAYCLRGHAAELDVTADRSDIHVAADVGEASASADEIGRAHVCTPVTSG